MPDLRVSPRERLVLTAIIELYIATGEPVASQAVAHSFAARAQSLTLVAEGWAMSDTAEPSSTSVA